MSTRSLPDGKAYRGSSLPSFCLQAKGSEHSFTTGRRVPERKSLRKRRYVRTQYSSSGPCVLNRWIEQKSEFFTTHFLAAAKVTHSRLRGGKAGLSSPPVNNFGRPIRHRGRGENAEEGWITLSDGARLWSKTQPQHARQRSLGTILVTSRLCLEIHPSTTKPVPSRNLPLIHQSINPLMGFFNHS